MIDQRGQLRDYIDSLTRRVIDEAGTPAPQRHKGRSASRARGYLASTAAAVALLVAVAVISEDGGDADRSVVATGRGLFVPPTSTEGDRTRLPLVFPDGSTVDLVYPKRGTIREVMRDRTPTKVYTGARGEDVPFSDSAAVEAAGPDLPQLAFQFGAWTVLAFDYPAGSRSRI